MFVNSRILKYGNDSVPTVVTLGTIFKLREVNKIHPS